MEMLTLCIELEKMDLRLIISSKNKVLHNRDTTGLNPRIKSFNELKLILTSIKSNNNFKINFKFIINTLVYGNQLLY